ncbi:MAG: NTP transferase domain-containing protein [archaeon]
MRRYNAVILGGGKSPADITLPKGNTSFNGGSLAGKVYEEVRKGFDFDRIALVMNPDDKINLRQGDVYVEPTFCKGAWLSGYRGIEATNDGLHNYVLVAGDLPFFDKHIMKAFMDEIESETAEIIFPLVSRRINEERFSQRKRTYQPLQEGEFLAGNLGYISQEALIKKGHFVDEIASSYQQKLRFIFKAISYLGFNTVLRSNHPKLPFVKALPYYEKLFPKFSKKELEDRASEFTGVDVKLIDFPYPESAFDIDKSEQLQLAEKLYLTDDLEARSFPANVSLS